MEHKAGSLRKSKEIDKLLARQTKIKRKKAQVTNIRNEIGDITTTLTVL